ncbi:MAG: hypothetical protein FJ276_09435 [Planctomycetes bacterium]|nr:hypothetical protein [Planctomycetota bacterium]
MPFPKNRLSLWLANTKFLLLLIYWLVAYAAIGVLFALLYCSLPGDSVASDSGTTKNFGDILHFSFTTQATVGYGDFFPLGPARVIAAFHAVIGIAFNAIALGLTAYKLIKRTSPLVLPQWLVYDPVAHLFLFRFWNVDADDLREVRLAVSIFHAQPSRHYDSVSNTVEMDYYEAKWVPSLHLFAVKSKSNSGTHLKELGADHAPLTITPRHVKTGTVIRIDLSGYFHTTGDPFFVNKDYTLYSIRCGRYEYVDNVPLMSIPPKHRAKRISPALDHTISTSEPDCRVCVFHKDCMLDVAAGARKG